MVLETSIQDQELQIKRLKRRLEGWRVALLPLKSVLLWEEQWHPCAVFGAVSFIYLIIWLMDPNILTALAGIGIIINSVDFIVPVISTYICTSSSWTGQKEKVFEDMCRSIVINYNNMLLHIKTFYAMRETSPRMYYILSIGILTMLAWIGSLVDNAFLLYLLSAAVLLWPGLQHRGLPSKCCGNLLSLLGGSTKNKFLKSE